MDIRTIAVNEAKQLIKDGLESWQGLVRTLDADERELLERALTRGAELQAALLVNPNNAGATTELQSIASTLGFIKDRANIDGSLLLRQFVTKVFTTITEQLLDAAVHYGAVAAIAI